MIAVMLVAAFALGYLTLCAVTSWGVYERLGAAFALGMPMVTMQMFVLGWAGVPYELTPYLTLMAVQCAALYGWLRARGARVFNGDDKAAPGVLPLSARLRGALAGVMFAWVALKLVSVFYMSSLRPLFAWDGWANWGARARLFYERKGLMLDFADHMFARGAVVSIPSYPPHLPLAEVWLYMGAGYSATGAKLLAPMILLGIALHLYGAVSKSMGRLEALACVVIMTGSPLLGYHATEGYADIWLAAAVYFGCASLIKSDTLMAGLWAGIAMWCKVEGIFFALALLLVLGTRAARGRGGSGLICATVAAVLFVLPWHIFRLHYDIGLGHETERVGLTFGAQAVRGAGQYYIAFHTEALLKLVAAMASMQSFGPFFVMLPFVVFAFKSDTWLLPMINFACFAVLYAFIGNWSEHADTFTQRNLLTLYPALCLLSAQAVARFIKQHTL